MTSGYRLSQGLGQWSIAEIPKHPRNYALWLQNMVRKLDQSLKSMMASYTERRDIYGDKTSHFYITRIQPKKSARIQWIWEIDCDHEIMHVDSRPFFRLCNLPRNGLFLESISVDHYGHRACAKSMPIEHRYNWTARPPPACPLLLERYRNLASALKVLPPRSLLGLPARQGFCEQVRCSLYQTMIGAALRTPTIAHDMPILEQASTPEGIPDSLVELGRAMLHIGLNPMIFCKFVYHLSHPVTHSQQRFQWLRSDVCVQFSTHLEDCDTLVACIASLVAKVQEGAPTRSTTYAIAISLTHISIAQIILDSNNAPQSISHTPALVFLPSSFATSPSTPGISAVVALSMALDNSHLLPSQPKRTLSAKNIYLPVEVWHEISSYLSSCSDLKTLAILSPQSRSAVQDLLRYPHIAGHRLLKALPDVIDSYWVSPRWCRTVHEDYLPQDGLQALYSQKFLASKDDDFGVAVQVAPGDPPLKEHTRSWSERFSNVPGFVKEGQFDLIPVDGIHQSGWAVKYGVLGCV
ncbi:hypothetical protein DFP72DRAFT_987514 [Ephemerocybe angulata]|uniref:F-box domain-containing protein n=1 Tax=Ephemerocybe angulata TaxID=980116 RepID=A0A8H6MEI9_9AGAR|nr:hypothetical protein DFP72DRAFT_987514 [Tulosesus angulatus]